MPKKIDTNHREIIAALRKLGATVWDTHAFGRGAPDFVCGYRGKNYLFEIKYGNGQLTKDEWNWQSRWNGSYYIVRSIDDAVNVITEDDDG